MNIKSGQKVSVIIPTYNRAVSIGTSIQSVLDQTWQDYEIIVVDDGSIDNTRQVMDHFIDDRIRYIYLEQNSGPSRARNEGIRQAKYEFIAFLDSDDEWLPQKLEKQMQVMLNAPETVGLVYCRVRTRKEDGDEIVCPSFALKKEQLEGRLLWNLVGGNVIDTTTMLIRRQCLEQAGGFDEGLRCLEDWELVLRIAENWEFGFVDEILVDAYILEGGVSSNSKGYVLTRCYMIAKYWELMAQRNILNKMVEEVLLTAKNIGYYEEAKQMLAAALHLETEG